MLLSPPGIPAETLNLQCRKISLKPLFFLPFFLRLFLPPQGFEMIVETKGGILKRSAERLKLMLNHCTPNYYLYE